MKRIIHFLTVPVLTLSLAGLLTGCSTTQTSKEALVCPDCKLVETRIDTSRAEPDAALPTAMTRMEHRCPGCQGSFATFRKEGKLRHSCLICAQGSSKCPLSHRL